MPTKALAFTAGDVLRTNPQPGYWGCAVVLTAFEGEGRSDPQFHIGITPIVLRQAYVASAIDLNGLKILQLADRIRVAADAYVERPPRACIGIWTAKRSSPSTIIARVDPRAVYEPLLTSEVGDGRSGAFPLFGPIGPSLGGEAVIAWRRKNDREAFERAEIEARRTFEASEQERLANQRARRRRPGYRLTSERNGRER